MSSQRVLNIIWVVKAMLHDWYWCKFSYADNRFCMFLENYISPRLVRWFAFHCYVITMSLLFVTLAIMLVSYAGELVDIIFNNSKKVVADGVL